MLKPKVRLTCHAQSKLVVTTAQDVAIEALKIPNFGISANSRHKARIPPRNVLLRKIFS